MSSVSSKTIPPIPASILGCSLIFIGFYYNIFSLLNFIERTNFILIIANKNDDFSIKKVRRSQINYTITALILSLAQAIIVFYVLRRGFNLVVE